MARSWERMVQRNQQQVNKQRKKQGKGTITASKSPAKNIDVFKGRNIAFPLVLVFLGSMFWVVASIDQTEGSGMLMNWLGVVMYYLLAALLFFRRPYLKVEGSKVSTTKFNRERVLSASDIESITLSRGAVTIKHKGKRKKWIFTRFLNRYDTEAMSQRLETFAKVNNVEIKHD